MFLYENQSSIDGAFKLKMTTEEIDRTIIIFIASAFTAITILCVFEIGYGCVKHIRDRKKSKLAARAPQGPKDYIVNEDEDFVGYKK
jgi:hypothetical protein